jgi:hypothetical protein
MKNQVDLNATSSSSYLPIVIIVVGIIIYVPVQEHAIIDALIPISAVPHHVQAMTIPFRALFLHHMNSTDCRAARLRENDLPIHQPPACKIRTPDTTPRKSVI